MSSSWAAGPAGLFMAARLARSAACATLVCEEHARVGDPVHCTGVLVSRQLRRLRPAARARRSTTLTRGALPLARRHSRRLHHADAAGHRDRSAGLRPRAGAIAPIAAGAEIRVGARVIGARADGPASRAHGRRRTRCTARLAVLACGANYKFQRRFGFGLPTTLSANGAARAAGAPPRRRRAALRPGRSRPAGSRGRCRCCAAGRLRPRSA